MFLYSYQYQSCHSKICFWKQQGYCWGAGGSGGREGSGGGWGSVGDADGVVNVVIIVVAALLVATAAVEQYSRGARKHCS